MAAPSKPPAKKGLNLTKKVGPLPVWAWAAIALIGGYLLYEHYKGTSSSATSTTTPASTAADPNTDTTGSGSGTSGTIPDQSATTPYGTAHGDTSSQLLSALEAETEALSNLSANQGAAGGTTTTTNNYYPVGGSGASGSTSAANSKTLNSNVPAATLSNLNSAPLTVPTTTSGVQLSGSLPTSANPVSVYAAPASTQTANDLNDITATKVAAPANSAAAVKASPTATNKAPTAAPTPAQKAKQSAGGHGAV